MKKQLTNNVKGFFKHDNYVSIQEDVKMMEFTVDLTIGLYVAVEYDDGSEVDIERMQKIALSNTAHVYWKDSKVYLHNTNDYKEKSYRITEYDGFTTYDIDGAFFIRVSDVNNLTWIPLVYDYYCEYIDFMFEDMETPVEHSDDLINMEYSC
jgi:hypothetical protein